MKKVLVTVLSALMIVCRAFVLVGCADTKVKKGEANKVSELKIANDGFIRVLQLTDLHLTKGSSKKEDKQTYKWVSEAVDYARPDVVAVTGDAVGGAYGRDRAIIELANLFEEKKVYWMYTFGNHDGEWSTATKTQVGEHGGLEGRLELLNLLKGYEYSLMVRGDENIEGIGNYFINFVNENNDIVHTLINMDSHGKQYDENGKDIGYIGIQPKQVEWYKDSLNALRNDEGIVPKSTLFMHVPIVEYRDAWNNLPHIGGFPEINPERKVYAPFDDNNVGMFDAIKDIGSTGLMSVGHDHDFNWLRDYDGLYMSYGRVSGVNAWGRRAPIGATIIDINTKASDREGMYKVSVIEPTFEYGLWEGQGKGW